MKILLVSLNHFPEQTGIGKFHGETAAWLATRGHQVRVVTAPPYYPAWKIAKGYKSWLYRRETIAGVRVYRAPLYVPKVPGGRRRLLHLLSFAAASFPLIVWQGLAWRPDTIMVTAPPLLAAPACLLAAKLSGAQTLLHVQDFEVDAAFSLGLLKKSLGLRLALSFEARMLRGFAAVSTISRRMRDRLADKGVARGRTHLIPNWASVGEFDPAKGVGDWPQKLGKRPGDVIALYAGNLGRKQGVDTIVEAARLSQDRPHIRYVVCGDGAARREIEAAAQTLANVTLLPVQDNDAFAHLMIAADIHLLPQKAQAADLVMPSKLGNILASGKPLVAGALPGTQLYDAIRGCGIAVEPDNAARFADAVAALADDAGLRGEMGLRGRQRALVEWSRDGILARLENILRGDSAPLQAGDRLDRDEAGTGKDEAKIA